MVQVEPFSVKHKYSGKWEQRKSELSTCNPSALKFVTDKDEKQEVKEHAEIIFTYDVSYKVSHPFVSQVLGLVRSYGLQGCAHHSAAVLCRQKLP